ncbi:MAG TPA: DUF5808 domain-containing protein [Acidobacteriaceae bacterium]|nr:DUF5808 domain-containing protein [Acidobacteriaceae bacterium]
MRIAPAVSAGQDSTSDRYWKGGFIYYNPGDPALMVPKRLGVGYTINFGRPVTWVLLVGILLLPVILPLILRSSGRH